MYSLGNNKPLIGKEQNYVLDRKLVTIHSEDRDITKWKNSYQFEITLPESILNVQSLRLVEVEMPANLYTFSDNYKNTQLSFTYNDSTDISNIKIGEGTYDPTNLAKELETRLNTINGGSNIHVLYDIISQKYVVGSDASNIELLFKDGSANYTYSEVNCKDTNISSNDNVNNRYTHWGLGYYLGFDKDNYPSLPIPTDTSDNYFVEEWKSDKKVLTYIKAPYKHDIMGEKCIYMEVEKYNSMDEIYPYTETSKDMYNHSGISGKVNSAFAKISINTAYNETLFNSRNISLENITHYDPPIERISKLKFTFRFHDGRYVDFQNNNFNFTLEFNSLKNEIGKNYNVRIPHTYLL